MLGQPRADQRGKAIVVPAAISERGAEAGHDLVRDACRVECERFFAAAAEHERISALEPDDAFTAPRCADHQAVDLGLRDRMAARALADEESLRAGGEREQYPRRELEERFDPEKLLHEYTNR